MSSEQQAIGMMEGAFFVPKGDLINWVNTLLNLQITKIEQLGTGAIYCQIIDSMFPGRVQMGRINWSARNEWQFINNFKILQQAFIKCKIEKYIDIEKLSKSKYQDNLEFIQWLKRFYDLFNKNIEVPYNAKAARKQVQVDLSFVEYRQPMKRELQKLQNNEKSRVKSRSPYDKIKSKVANNRSITVNKYKNKNLDVYLYKLCQIKDILKKQYNLVKPNDSIKRIKQIVQDIQDDLAPVQEQQVAHEKIETLHSMVNEADERREKEKHKAKQNKSQLMKQLKKGKK